MTTLHKTDGIILGHYDIGEADKIINIFTKDYGKISISAKGVRLQKSKLRGHINTGSHVRIVFVGGSEFLRLTDIEERDNFLHKYSDSKIGLFAYSATLINRMIQGSDRDEDVWDLFYGFLKFLDSDTLSESPDVLKKMFGVRLLYRLGYVAHIGNEAVDYMIASSSWSNLLEADTHIANMGEIFEKGMSASHL